MRLGLGGIERTFEVHRVGETYYVDSPLGSSTLVEVPRFTVPEEQVAAGSLVAPLPGVVDSVKVREGEAVVQGQLLLVIDSMKVHHWISAPLAGRVVQIHVEPGHHVEVGAVLVVIE